MILVYLGRWSYGRFQDDNNIFYKMKNDLTTGTWQDNIWCPKIIILFCTSDDGDKVAALKSYSHTNLLRFWGFGSLVESKWCHYIMFEAESQLKLLSTYTLDIYKVFEHIDMLSMGIWQ